MEQHRCYNQMPQQGARWPQAAPQAAVQAAPAHVPVQKRSNIVRLASAKVVGAVFWLEVAAVLLAVVLCFGGLPFGITPYVVQSGSMTPALPVGSIVYVDTKADAKGLTVGDVIAFDLGEGKTCTHRISAVNADGTYTTKGDANGHDDAAAVPPSEVFGVVMFDIPFAGFVLTALTQHRVVFAICAFAILLGTYGLSRLLEGKEGTSKPRGRP